MRRFRAEQPKRSRNAAEKRAPSAAAFSKSRTDQIRKLLGVPADVWADTAASSPENKERKSRDQQQRYNDTTMSIDFSTITNPTKQTVMSFDAMHLTHRRTGVCASSILAPERLVTCDKVVDYLFGGNDAFEDVVSKRLRFMLKCNSELVCAFAQFILVHHETPDLKRNMRELTWRLVRFLRTTNPHGVDHFCVDRPLMADVFLLLHNVAAAVLADAFFRRLDALTCISLVKALSHFCRTLVPFTQCKYDGVTTRQAFALVMTTSPHGVTTSQLIESTPPPALDFLLRTLAAEFLEHGVDVGRLSRLATPPLSLGSPMPLAATPPGLDDGVIRVPAKRRRLDVSTLHENPISVPTSPMHSCITFL